MLVSIEFSVSAIWFIVTVRVDVLHCFDWYGFFFYLSVLVYRHLHTVINVFHLEHKYMICACSDSSNAYFRLIVS